MAASTPSGRAYFEQQREALMGEIAMVIDNQKQPPPVPMHHPVHNTKPPARDTIILTRSSPEPAQSFEQVLANINKLNRNLEAVITVGNEFSSVEALWSTFENVMAKEEEGEGDDAAEGKLEEAADGGDGGDDGAERGQEEIEVDGEQDRTLT